MRGTLTIVLLVALLIVGILTIKNMKTETVDGVKREEAVDRARETAGEAEKAMDRIKESVKDIEIPLME